MSGLRAMLIDASHESAVTIKNLLSKHDVEVVEWAVTGVGWITPFQEKKPDILFVDFMLPKRDGIYCLDKALKLISVTKAVFLHSYSGITANEIELKAMALGATAVIQRPIVESRFHALMTRMVVQMKLERTQLKKSLVLAGKS